MYIYNYDSIYLLQYSPPSSCQKYGLVYCEVRNQEDYEPNFDTDGLFILHVELSSLRIFPGSKSYKPRGEFIHQVNCTQV